jgi:uncharacterized delta-60 repeat protein
MRFISIQMTTEAEVFIVGNLCPRMRVETYLLLLLCVDCLGQIGMLDDRFDPGHGLNIEPSAGAWLRVGSAEQGVFVAGSFTEANGTNRNHIARLNSGGGLDLSFDPGTGAQDRGLTVLALAIQPDGKVIIGGVFTNVNGYYRNRIARLNADGSVDQSFECNPGPNGLISRILLQSDGKLLVRGSFTQWSIRDRRFVVRLMHDGRSDYLYDTSWNDVAGDAMALQLDGKLLIGGFPYMFDTDVPIIRINTNGTRDLTFRTEVEFNVKAVALEPDGRIVIAGGFEHVNGARRVNIARLNPDGSTDLSFDANLPYALGVSIGCIARCPDGKWLAGGYFAAQDGYPGNYLMRLNSDGSFDDSFDSGLGPNGWVSDLALQNDGKVLIVGNFTSVDGIPRNGIARLHGDPRLSAQSVPQGVEISWPSIYTNFVLQTASILPSTNWITVTNSPVLLSNFCVLTNPITSSNQFFRLAKP